MKLEGIEQAIGSDPRYITCDKSGHFFPKGQCRSRWTANFNAGPHVGWISQQAQGCRLIFGCFGQFNLQLFIAELTFTQDQGGVHSIAFGVADCSHCRLQHEAGGRQGDQQAAEQHIVPDICKNCRTQHNLQKGQQSVCASPEASMHLFEGLAVVQGEFQFMSGHVLFLIPFLACLMVETAAAGQGSVARGHNHDHSIRIGQCELQVVAAYQLPLIGDCLSTFTISREESLSQTGRGPALRAFTLVACELTLLANESYSVGAAAKSAAGICTPSSHLELTHALAWFFVSNRPPFFGVLFAYPAIGILSVMVARAGQPSGWPVSSGCAGSANPVRATTMRFAPLVGSDNLSHPEAAIMATVPTPVTPVIQVIDGQAVTTSLDLAAYFGKQHKNVTAKIETLECSPEFTELNFKLSTYTDPTGRECPCYLLTRDGFCFIAMGFTGRRASEFKERYIAAFNAMERQGHARYLAAPDANALAHSVSEARAFYKMIRMHWESEIYPSLKAVKSPLAYELYDRFEWMSYLLIAIAHQVESHQTAQVVQGGQHEKA